MSCTLLDLGCHAVSIGADLWGGFSLPSKVLIVAGLLSIAGGALWGAGKALKAFGGWPAVIGAAAVLLGLVIAVWPQKPTPAPVVAKPAVKPAFQFGVDRARKKKRVTIFDLGKGRP